MSHRLPEGPLTLEQALKVALANNPDLRSAGWEVQAARARQREASAGHWPALTLAAAFRYHWHEERLAPARSPNTPATTSHAIFYGDVVLTVPLFSGGRVVSAVAASELAAGAAGQQLARTRDELVFNVKSAFFGLLGQRRLVRAVEQCRAALQEHLSRTRELLAAQKAARVDVLNLEVRLADLDQQLVRERGAVALGERLLLSLMGIEELPREGLSIQGDLAPPDVAVDRRELLIQGDLGTPNLALDRGKLLAAAQRQRPDVARLQLEVEAQARRVDMVRAEYWPAVAARGTYGARANAGGDYDDLGFAGIDLLLPVFTGGATMARVDAERARLRALQARRQALVLQVRREVASAVIQVQNAAARAHATHKAIAMAEESLRIARQKALLGHGTTLDVLEAQAALLGAQTSRSAALADLHAALALLELVTGGAS